MVVRLDLRIPGKGKSKIEAESGLSHYLVFAAAALFLFTVLAVILLGSWKIYELQSEKKELQAKNRAAAQNLEIMDTEFSRLKKEAEKMDKTLAFMLGDMPAIEVLAQLDTVLPDGVTLSSLAMTPEKVVFKGIAAKEEEVMKFVSSLSSVPFALSVEVPAVTYEMISGRRVTSFSLECRMRTMQEIQETGAFSSRAAKTSSEDVNP